MDFAVYQYDIKHIILDNLQVFSIPLPLPSLPPSFLGETVIILTSVVSASAPVVYDASQTRGIVR